MCWMSFKLIEFIHFNWFALLVQRLGIRLPCLEVELKAGKWRLEVELNKLDLQNTLPIHYDTNKYSIH